MLNLIDLLVLVWVHLIADFFMQTDRMALNKSTSNKWLGIHVCVYGLPLLIFGVVFAVVNVVLHFMTDYVTSRVTTYLWHKGKRRMFFNVIGVDQAVHMTCLLITYRYLGQPL